MGFAVGLAGKVFIYWLCFCADACERILGRHFVSKLRTYAALRLVRTPNVIEMLLMQLGTEKQR